MINIEKEKVLLSGLSDKQKTLLSNISYLNLDMEKYNDIKNKKDIKVSDLKELLENSDSVYLGDMSEVTTGLDITHEEYVKQLEEEGLGDLMITDYVENSDYGFSAMSFSDNNNNTGISYRGTDAENPLELLRDANIDVHERLLGETPQSKQALEFYEKNKSNDGQNYLYGHSLGGNLVEHVYLENHKDIDGAFVINALPIDEDLLDSKEKIKAFNNSEKFDCIVVGGDPVSELDSYNKYNDNVRFIVNNKDLNNNMIGNHLIQSASYDEKGNFIEANSKEQAYNKNTSIVQKSITSLTNSLATKVETILKKAKETFNSIIDNGKTILENTKDSFNNFIDKGKTVFGDIKDSLNNFIDKGKTVFENKKDSFNNDSTKEEENSSLTEKESFLESIRVEDNNGVNNININELANSCLATNIDHSDRDGSDRDGR